MIEEESMNKVDARLAAQMLRIASSEFGNHGCNDYELPNTPENLAFVKRLNVAAGYHEDELNISENGKVIYLINYQIMDYCAKVLEEYADRVETMESYRTSP
jgi:hypothetical protein